jgi:hypothetical protein
VTPRAPHFFRLSALLAVLLLTTGCGDPPPPEPSPTPAAPHRPSSPPVFRDATREAGIRFVHQQSDHLIYMPDTSSPGVGMIDVDADGFEDLFFLQGSGKTRTHDPARMPPSELYRNDGAARFEECGAMAGLDSRGYAQGCLVWDYDNDGYPDLFVSNWREPLQLYRNNGDGTFKDVAEPLGVAGTDLAFASSLTAIDYDRDGLQDVYVGQYVDFEDRHFVEAPEWVKGDFGGPLPSTLMPGRFAGLPKRLYHNLGSRFEDVTGAMAVADPEGRTYAAVSADFDRDGWPDLFVANDIAASAVFRNDRGRRFIDERQLSWLVADGRGAMGIAVGDYNLDLKLDAMLSRWWVQPALYQNIVGKSGRPGIRFIDRAEHAGYTQRPLVGWGIGFIDVDNDGFEDVLQINGDTNPDLQRPGQLGRQPAYLWRMVKGRVVELVNPAPGDPLGKVRVGRGTAFGDLDNDGYVDVAVGNNNEPGELWMNGGEANDWIGFRARGTLSNRDGMGMRITLVGGPHDRMKVLASGESFFSANAKQLVFGLGAHRGAVTADVWWPSGRHEAFPDLAAARYHMLVEGTGAPVNAATAPATDSAGSPGPAAATPPAPAAH